MTREHLRFTILAKAHSVCGHELDKMKEIKSELLKFLGDDFDFDKHMHDVGDHDAHVIDALLMLEIAVSETEYNDFQKCCELAAPIFKRFSKMKLRGMDYKDYDDDNFYIVMCMVRVIGYAKDLTSFFAASIPLANELQRYSLTPDYLNDKMALHMNSLFRLLRARKYEFTNDGYAEDIKLHFEMHYKYTQDIFHKDHKRFMLRKLVADVRHGIFHKDQKTVKVGLAALKIFEYHDVIKIMHTEIDEYGCDCIKIKDE